jgi:hypothetical protein
LWLRLEEAAVFELIVSLEALCSVCMWQNGAMKTSNESRASSKKVSARKQSSEVQ